MSMQQMEMFNIGGLKDEGGSKDPVSGNDVPTGSLKEEVRDDIDAKLSPGEFVFSADVTRFYGLNHLIKMRDKAKAGLKRMEAMGQMGNSEEATLDDDVPFEQSDLLIVAGSPMEEQMNALNRGGMPIRASNGTAVPNAGTTVPGLSLGAGRGDQLIGSNLQQYFNPTTNEIRSVLVSRDNLTGELQPVSPLPEGFIRDTPENRTNAMQPTKTSASVETTRVDPDVLMQSSDIGNVRGAPDPSDARGYQTGNTLADIANNPNPSAMSLDQMANYGDVLSGKAYGEKVGAFTSVLGEGVAAATRLGFGDIEKKGQAQSIALSNMRANNKEAYASLQATFDNNLGKNVDKAKDALAAKYGKTMSLRDIETTARRGYGITNAQVLAHLDKVDRGEAPVGSQANAIGGYSTTGAQGHSTNANGDVVGKDANQALSDIEEFGVTPTATELEQLSYGTVDKSLKDKISEAKGDRKSADERSEEAVATYGSGAGPMSPGAMGGRSGFGGEPIGMGGGMEGSTSGPSGGPGSGPDPSGMGGFDDPSAGQDDSQAPEEHDGGLIERPKRKKQKKKMKRGGLASRK